MINLKYSSIVLIIMMLIANVSFAQKKMSKKDEIIWLKSSIDSVNTVLKNERNTFNVKSEKLNETIQQQNTKLEQNTAKNKALASNLTSKQQEIDKQTEEIEKLNKGSSII